MKTNNVQSVIKAMRIFEELVYCGEPLSLTRLSEKVGLNISTVHRLVNTLLHLNYVEQNKEGLYKLGLLTYQMAELINRDFDLREVVRPFLEDIVRQFNETSNLVVFENNQVVYLDQVESNNMVRMFASVGSRGPAYCTGAGKMLLSYLNEQELAEYIQETDFVSHTENTFANPGKLKLELLKIKGQGYSLDLEEREIGVRCLSVPIENREGRALGALSISGPSARMTMEFIMLELLPVLRKKTEKIKEKIR